MAEEKPNIDFLPNREFKTPAFKGVYLPTQPDHTGILLRSYGGTFFLMLWSYQKQDPIEHGWLVFMLQDDMQPYWFNRLQEKPYFTRVYDVEFQVIGIASSLKVTDPKPEKPSIKFIRTAFKRNIK